MFYRGTVFLLCQGHDFDAIKAAIILSIVFCTKSSRIDKFCKVNQRIAQHSWVDGHNVSEKTTRNAVKRRSPKRALLTRLANASARPFTVLCGRT